MSARKRLISRGEWRMFWMVSLGLSILAGGGTAAILFFNKPEEPKNLLPTQSPFAAGVDDTIPEGMALGDFWMPAPGGQWLSRSWMFSRQAGQAWSPEEIRPYWTPASSLPILKLPQDNDAQMERFFEDVH